ncbi:MAG TPA: sarcosine oxidase subunit delta [Steroidobacteraceae bacterium]|nr:sarcosine oxidase subunit delta [Steroidobacteraceae bacterium]
MRIQCPYCGERDLSEFAYLGDAHFERPDPAAAEAPRQFFEAVYLRDNPAGPHVELWYHSAGCRSWLRVARDTLTHELLSVELARRHTGTSHAGTARDGDPV